jgi:hypothetical protein
MAAMGACRAVERDDGGPEIWLESIDGTGDGALSKPSRVIRRLLTSLRQNSTRQIACRVFRRSFGPLFFRQRSSALAWKPV